MTLLLYRRRMDEPLALPVAFVVRAARQPDGAVVTGTVERALTGRKVRFRSAEDLLKVLVRMLAGPTSETPNEGGVPRKELT